MNINILLIIILILLIYLFANNINKENFKGKNSNIHSWCHQGMKSNYKALQFEQTNQPIPPMLVNPPNSSHTICATGECNDSNCGCQCAQANVYKNPLNLGNVYQSEEEITIENNQREFESQCNSILCRLVNDSEFKQTIINNIIQGNYSDNDVRTIIGCNQHGLLKLSNYYSNCL
jgi:hypothetical protein